MEPAALPLESLPFVQALRDAGWVVPALQVVHTLGFVVLVGSVIMFDLRILGLSKGISVRALARHLLPWSWASLALIVPTGLVMFLLRADELLGDGRFQLKMGLLMLAGINVIVFHTGPYQGVEHWDVGKRSPVAAQLLVIVSIAIWIAIIACGRVLAKN